MSRVIQQILGFLKTPSLFITCSFTGITSFHLPFITNEEVEGIANRISLPTKLVMGKRMEHFFKDVISMSSQTNLIAHNIQLHCNKITVGELDFLVEDINQNKIVHVELMYKIYVYDPELPTEMERWIGPNRKDSLIEKLEKVKKHQLPLLYSSVAKEHLKTLQISAENIEQQICYKAKLFIPKHLSEHHFPEVNNKCIAGFWYDLPHFKEVMHSDYKFYAPEKQDWPSDPANNSVWMTYSEINKQIQAMHLQKKSPLIWISKQTGEFESAIVVWW